MKKILTREEFEKKCLAKANEMSCDKELQQDAIDVFSRADKHYWIHQTRWMGEPILQTPQDLFAIQEIIVNTRPEYIIEIGTAWSGSLLFYATIIEVLQIDCDIIGVDIFIPDDLKERINGFEKLAKKIKFIEGSSIEQNTVNKIKSMINNSKKVLIHLDSNHTHEHVLKELNIYTPFVGKGYYLICGDTMIEYFTGENGRTRKWSKGDNPKTALDEFMKDGGRKRFVNDRNIENKLLFTNNPTGYLKCIKDL